LASYCLDANIVITKLFERGITAVDEFFESLNQGDQLSASALLYPEVVTSIREAAFEREIPTDAAAALLEQFLNLNIVVLHSPQISRRAYELAVRFRHKKAYDDHYLAAAEASRSIIVTRDRGMRHAATQIGVPIRFLA
jgi:predicted nucleic acid-binding protein